jgi:ankyrin repeat protein
MLPIERITQDMFNGICSYTRPLDIQNLLLALLRGSKKKNLKGYVTEYLNLYNNPFLDWMLYYDNTKLEIMGKIQSYYDTDKRMNYQNNVMKIRRHNDDFSFVGSVYFSSSCHTLTYAAMIGHIDVVDWLVNHAQVDINFTDDINRPALIYAIRAYQNNMVKWLVQNGADVNICDIDNRDIDGDPIYNSCMSYICNSSNWAMMEDIVNFGNIDIDGLVETLYCVLEHGQTDLVTHIVEHSIINLSLHYHRHIINTACAIAASNNHLNIVKCLTEHGADVNIPVLLSKDGDIIKIKCEVDFKIIQTVLYDSAIYSNGNIFKYITNFEIYDDSDEFDFHDVLYSYNIDYHTEIPWGIISIHMDKYFTTYPLQLAASNGHKDVVKYLLDHVSDFQIGYPNAEQLAYDNGHDMTDLFVNAHMNYNICVENHKMRACVYNNIF